MASLYDNFKPLTPEETDPEKENMSVRNKRALLAGATPLLVGLLAGDTGTGVEIAAEGLLKEDELARREDESLFAAFQKKKAAATPRQGRRFQAIPVEDESGNITVSKFDTHTGDIAPTEVRRGYRKSLRTDPTTGELVTSSGSTGRAAPTIIEGQKEVPFTVKEEKDVVGLEKAFLADPEVKRARSGLSASGRAIELLKSDNPVSDEGIKTVFPRMFGEVGNLAVQEQERFSGSSALARRFARLREKYSEGKLTDEDRRDLIEVAQVMFAYDKRNANKLADQYSTSTSRRTGMDAERLRESISPFIGLEAPKGSVVKEVKKDFGPRLQGVEKSAYEWAIKNKKDRRSKKIIKKLEDKYGI